MKTTFLTLFIISLLSSIPVMAQAPPKVSYQAVIRDAGGELVTEDNVGIRIQLLQGSQDGTPVYVETHTVASNANGLITLEIGGGSVVAGAIQGINWANGPYFIKTETDPNGGTAYSISSTSQLLSVPYAFFANQAATVSGGSTAPVAVGDLALGGIVVYVNATGTHGLVVATQDQSKASNWFTAQNNISNPANHDAAGKEYSDWRLPTRYELNLMYTVLHTNGLGGFLDGFYWSSTEDDVQNSWRQQFTDGRQALINKGAPSSVRAVRVF